MVSQRKIAVVVDTSSCLPEDHLEKWNIHTVPHRLILNDQTYLDGIDISPATFYKIMEKDGVTPTTAAPPPTAFLDAFRKARTVADDIICITVASNLSSAHNSAQAAAETARSEPGGEIVVMDSRAAAGAHGLITLEAAHRAHRGESLSQVSDAVRNLIPRVTLLAYVETLHYLKKGGRVPKVAAWAGSILGIKPIAELSLGEARVIGKLRSRPNGIRKLADLARSRVGDRAVNMNVMHANALEDAEGLSELLSRELTCRNIIISEFTPVMGAHLGPGVVGLAFFPDEDMPESEGQTPPSTIAKQD